MIEGTCICGSVTWQFDGLDTFDELPRDGKCVADYLF
jgi:hypothetical protein